MLLALLALPATGCSPQAKEGAGHCMISAGELHTVGLKKDGSVVAVGDNNYDVDSWNLKQ